MDSALLGGLSKAHGGAIKRHGMAAKQRFMRSTTSKIAAGIGLASIANLASQRQQQKAFLQATSGKSAKEIDALFDKITDNAIAAGVPIEKQVQLMQAMQDMGGLLDVGTKHLRFFSDVLQGTGAAAQDVAGMATTLVKVLDVPLKKAFAILVEQGNQGNATLAQLARYAPGPLGAYKSLTGRSGEQSVREVGAMMQVGTSALGSVEKGSTASRALIARLTEEENLALMQRSGIETHDKDGKMRSLLDILADMAKLTEGDPSAQKRTARQLNIGVEELPLFLSLLGKGLKEARALAAVPGSRNTISNQARPLQRTAAAGVVRTTATAEKVLMPAADKAANVVGKVLSNKKGFLAGLKEVTGLEQWGKDKKKRTQRDVGDFLKGRNDPQNQNNQTYRKMAVFYKSMEHLSKQQIKLLEKIANRENQALITPLDIGMTKQ